MNEQECKYLRPEDQTCRLEGGKADPDRCAGCRWIIKKRPNMGRLSPSAVRGCCKPQLDT